jgi:SAM-dependent methyltransferase
MSEQDFAREQLEHWNGPGGNRWVTQQERLDRVLAPLGALAVERAAPQAAERVLDVGCGCGASTLELGRRVGSSGAVLGVDISAPMLARARERAAAMRWVSFAESDAGSHAFAPDHDLVFSRFGSMFFARPEAAFANLRRALRPGGRLCLIVWRTFEENEWGRVPMEAAISVVGPQQPPPPGAPGPFSLASPERVQQLLAGAGFQHVQLERDDRTLEVSTTGLDEAVEFSLQAGPAARLLIGADPTTLARVTEAVRKALAPRLQNERVALGAATWVVTANA